MTDEVINILTKEIAICEKHNCAYSHIKLSLEQLHTIRTCLKQAMVAQEMAEALKSASAYISQNKPHWSAPYHNETTRKIIEALAKWEEMRK